VREFPWHLDSVRHLGRSFRMLGDYQRSLGRFGAAAASLQQAQRIFDALVKANPSVFEFQADLAACYVTQGQASRTQNKLDEAFERFQKAQLVLETLARIQPGVRQFQSELAMVYFQIGVTHHENKNPTAARQAYQISRELWDKVVRANPQDLHYRANYSDAL